MTQIFQPDIGHIKIYFNQKGIPEAEADKFIEFYNKREWKSRNGNDFKSWKQLAFWWIQKYINSRPLLFDRYTR